MTKITTVRTILLLSLLGAGCYFDFNNPIEHGIGERLQDCIDACPRVVAAACSHGPQEIADCEQGCRTSDARCPRELGDVMLCLTSDAAYRCDANIVPYPEGCEDEQALLMACLGDGPGATQDPYPDWFELMCREHYWCTPESLAHHLTEEDGLSHSCEWESPTTQQDVEGACLDSLRSTWDLFSRDEQDDTDAAYSCFYDNHVVQATCDPVDAEDALQSCATQFSGVELWGFSTDGVVCNEAPAVAPIVECRNACPDAVAAGCTGGPQSIVDCEMGCQTSAENCSLELWAIMECLDSDDVYLCDDGEVPYPIGCEEEHQSLMRCLATAG